ncbi:MAG: vitamin B12 dependent-methionine synthase activation domain-containing protein [Candidatus Electryonea clarkiae]|nr:vitamin B12 dependent-methionine synthase activation domain-containing protein [Candidatus Electryonea clarkiae]MDP8285250.1 vitamin B12 dependent-methionine synthase activation domain-containing protein [Candidatus Electryonea clarkiae]
MKQNIELSLSDILPGKNEVLFSLGIPVGTEIVDSIQALFDEALDLFHQTVQPSCIVNEISYNEFERIFRGEGKNADDVLLKYIYPKANHLALYALTMGKTISDKIDHLFNTNDFALGTMLDSVASNAADKASNVVQDWYFNELSKTHGLNSNSATLGYSPGYCGWDISGQKKLFQYLEPEQIGIILSSSFLMIPLKSITGLLVAGKKEIHLFKDNYSYCSTCKNRSCIDRMKKLRS